MGIGIRNAAVKVADTTFTNSAALLSIGLASPIAAGQTQHIRYFVLLTIGATGGIRLQIFVPAGGVAFIAGIVVIDTVNPANNVLATQTASAVLTTALPDAGTHWIIIDLTVINGATAGDIDLRMAQNTADPLTLTVLAGAVADIIKF